MHIHLPQSAPPPNKKTEYPLESRPRGALMKVPVIVAWVFHGQCKGDCSFPRSLCWGKGAIDDPAWIPEALRSPFCGGYRGSEP